MRKAVERRIEPSRFLASARGAADRAAVRRRCLSSGDLCALAWLLHRLMEQYSHISYISVKIGYSRYGYLFAFVLASGH